jgi:hypothetical protein
MPATVIYDSGATVPVSADTWQEYRKDSSMVLIPVAILLKLDPFEEVSNTWNLWGYACTEVTRFDLQFLCNQTPLSAAGATIPSGATSRREGLYTYLDCSLAQPVGGKINNFTAVHFCINRWVGPSRVRIVVQT